MQVRLSLTQVTVSTSGAQKAHIHGAKKILIVVGFIMKSGADELVKLCKNHGIKPSNVTIITGLSFGITEPKALRCLLQKNFSLRLFPEGSKIFHPKVYIFQKKAASVVLVGSANLSRPALTDNIEAALLLTLPSDSTEIKGLMNFWAEMLNASKPASNAIIKDYASKRKPRPYAEPRIKPPKPPRQSTVTRAVAPKRVSRKRSPIIVELRRRKIIKDHPGRLMFKGKMFELTGRFQHGYQSFCAKEIRKRGGQVEPFNVTKNTDVLVVGSLGNLQWFMKTFGKKMLKADKYRQETGRPLIISEEQWEKAL